MRLLGKDAAESRTGHYGIGTLKMLKHRIKNALRACGIVIKRVAVDNVDENLRALFQRLEINCVLDVGAHYGEYGRRLRALGYKGRIVSFEPVSASYKILSDIAGAESNWVAHNVALGRQASSAEIKIPNHSELASFLDTSAYSAAEFGSISAVARTETVKILTLDSVFQECIRDINSPRVFLKMDTQGFDLEVMGGASDTLKCVVGMQSEVSIRNIYDAMPDWKTAIGLYQSLGYEITGLYPVTRDKNLLVMEFDCLLARASSL
jgi:FkbM family methyltransferase